MFKINDGFSLSDAELPNDPYTSYLLWPRLHFNGTYHADVATVNNHPPHYDTGKFVPADQLPNPHTLNYNPHGSDDWSIYGSVTHLCYANGHCLGDDEGDNVIEPALGTPILSMFKFYSLHEQFLCWKEVKRNVTSENLFASLHVLKKKTTTTTTTTKQTNAP